MASGTVKSSIALVVCLAKVISGQLLLADQSWTVTSVINYLGGEDTRYPDARGTHIFESYSPSQSKATIHFSSLVENEATRFGTFYLDNKYEIFLFDDGSKKESCKTTTLADFYNKLRFDISGLTISDYFISKVMIGPARLLYFIEEHRSKLKLASLSEKVLVRNILCLEYTMSYETNLGDNINLTIFYDANLVAQNVDTLPIKIFIEIEDQDVSLDFSQLNPLRDSPLISDSIVHNHFIIPTSCTQTLLQQKKDIYLFRDVDMVRFSFKAEAQSKLELFSSLSKTSLKVTYDLALNSLRIDTKTDDNQLIQEITNFKAKRRHVVVEDLSVDQLDGNNKMNCTVFMTAAEDSDDDFTIGKMLTGSNLFAYLGKAIVRGISAKMYATVGGSVPQWLDQPIEYKALGSTHKRDPSLGPLPSKNARSNVTTVIYLSDQELPTLLLITVKNLDIFRSVDILDFHWEFDYSETTSDIFSLHDSCTALNTPHKHVNLFLSSSEPFTEEPSKPALDLTILAALQDSLSLPVTMTYDLEYKFLRNDLAITLNVASYPTTIAELVFLGRGYRSYNLPSPLEIRRIRSFQLCFQLAAAWKKNLFFAFNRLSYTCLIETTLTNSTLTQSAFKLEVGNVLASLEIYQVLHSVESKINPGSQSDDTARWIEEKRFRMINIAKQIGKKMKLSPFNPMRNYIFYVESLKVDTFEPDGTRFTKLNNTLDINTFLGFGLKEGSENRRVLVPSSHSRSWASKESELDASLMSFAQCESACMFDSQCRSFSVCRRGYELECVISKLSFRSELVAEQLMKLSRSNSDTKEVQVSLEDQKKVELIKRATCELHNKLYLNLFYLGKSYIYFIQDQMLQPVLGVEECAQLCVDINLFILSEDAKLSKQLSEFSDVTSDFSVDDMKKFDQILSTRNKNSGLLCSEFLYLDKSQLTDENLLRNIEQRTLDSPLDPNQVEGFCQISAYKMNEKSKPGLPSFKLTYRRYEFILESFYETLKGVQLRASPTDDSDRLSYDLVKHGSASLNLTSYLRLQELVESGHNFQELIYGDSAKCASVCFQGALSHTMGPWPMCRSYDIRTDPNTGVKVCFLNSITIQDAISNDKLDLIIESQSTSVHYEPSFILQKALPDGAYQLVELGFQVDVHEKDNKVRLNIVSLTAIIILAACCGLFLGSELMQQVLDYQNRRNRDGDDIRGRLTQLEFSNQVNGSGIMT